MPALLRAADRKYVSRMTGNYALFTADEIAHAVFDPRALSEEDRC